MTDADKALLLESMQLTSDSQALIDRFRAVLESRREMMAPETAMAANEAIREAQKAMWRVGDLIITFGKPRGGKRASSGANQSGKGPVYDIRTKAGLTQKELAQRVGCDTATIHRSEANGVWPRSRALRTAIENIISDA